MSHWVVDIVKECLENYESPDKFFEVLREKGVASGMAPPLISGSDCLKLYQQHEDTILEVVGELGLVEEPWQSLATLAQTRLWSYFESEAETIWFVEVW